MARSHTQPSTDSRDQKSQPIQNPALPISEIKDLPLNYIAAIPFLQNAPQMTVTRNQEKPGMVQISFQIPELLATLIFSSHITLQIP